ncbi:MAG: hypothetical protein HRT88_12425, partial [Lentisphaeraceae bacterium]|nr:hypothetical protein [Lentisphaeraceae bacterium]
MTGHIGAYKLLEKIAEGATGEIYLVENERSEVLALKLLKLDIIEADRVEAHRRFEREIILTKKVSHKNIVAVQDSGFEGDKHYLV